MNRTDNGADPVTRLAPAVSLAPASALDDPRLAQATEEYEALLKAGHRPDRPAFLARHADLGDALARCLDAIEFVHAAGPRLSRSGGPGGGGTDLLPSGVPLG